MIETEARALHLLLVEDDDGDAFLVEELLRDSGLLTEMTRAWSLEAARDALAVSVDCVLLDLGLPDATGLDALVQLREHSDAALVVLTGLDDSQSGVDAVSAGADDYLVKGHVDGEALGRAIRYAIERRRGERERRQQEARRARAADVTELAQELRPEPHVPHAPVRVVARTEEVDQLSPQLWDVVERPDGTVLAVMGTSDGSGTCAAALAVTVRAAFRALALTALPAANVLEVLERVVSARAAVDTVRALVVELDPLARRVTCHLAGHHPPLVLSPDGMRAIADDGDHGRRLGTGARTRPAPSTRLGERDRLLLLHDAVLARADTASESSSLGVVLSAATRGGGDDSLADTVERAVRAYGPEDAEVQVVMLGWSPV